MFYEKLIDILMFRQGTEEDEEGTMQPVITTGSIVWGIILRMSIIVFLSFLLFSSFEMRQYWWISLLAIWAIAAYPGWRQFAKFQENVKKVEESTLCGSCRHFDKTSQLCRIFDEHVSKDYIPCEGISWEPRHYDSDEEDD
jgi:hypothetical protein